MGFKIFKEMKLEDIRRRGKVSYRTLHLDKKYNQPKDGKCERPIILTGLERIKALENIGPEAVKALHQKRAAAGQPVLVMVDGQLMHKLPNGDIVSIEFETEPAE